MDGCGLRPFFVALIILIKYSPCMSVVNKLKKNITLISLLLSVVAVLMRMMISPLMVNETSARCELVVIFLVWYQGSIIVILWFKLTQKTSAVGPHKPWVVWSYPYIQLSTIIYQFNQLQEKAFNSSSVIFFKWTNWFCGHYRTIYKETIVHR